MKTIYCKIEQTGTGCTISGGFTNEELQRFFEAGWVKVENLQEADCRIGGAK